MLKKFRVTVNGNTYEVEVEEIKKNDTNDIPVKSAEKEVVKEKPKKIESAAKEKKEIPSDGIKITAPMPGTIIDVKIKEGQNVKKGDVLTILEAMKMENEIIAPENGTVSFINVASGASVNTGDILVVLK